MNSIDAQRLSEQLRQRGLGYLLLDVYDRVASTQCTLQQRSERDDIHGHVVVAAMQTQGRGRRGKTWVSPASGNLYASIGWRWPSGQSAIGTLSLTVGCAIAEALESDFGVSAQLKWPNDLMINSAKLGGILIDVIPDSRGLVSIIGVGLNIAMASHMATDVDQAWTDLHSSAPGGAGSTMPDTQRVAGSVIGAVVDALEQFGDTGFEPWRVRWQRRDMLLGRELLIKAECSWVGVGAGIADDGALLVETAQGRIPVYAGDVSVRPLIAGDGAR